MIRETSGHAPKHLMAYMADRLGAALCLLNPVVAWPEVKKLRNGKPMLYLGQSLFRTNKEKQRSLGPLLLFAVLPDQNTANRGQPEMSDLLQQVGAFSKSQYCF